MSDQRPIIGIKLSMLVQALYDANEMGGAVEDKTLMAGFVETPRGANIAEAGQSAISKLESLPENHPNRTRFDLDRMRKGIDYLTRGVIAIVPTHSDTEAPVQGEYLVRIYNA